ncbi:MAG: hypothetical protein WCW27_06135 [Patescibacteria group bacterium]
MKDKIIKHLHIVKWVHRVLVGLVIVLAFLLVIVYYNAQIQ